MHDPRRERKRKREREASGGINNWNVCLSDGGAKTPRARVPRAGVGGEPGWGGGGGREEGGGGLLSLTLKRFQVYKFQSVKVSKFQSCKLSKSHSFKAYKFQSVKVSQSCKISKFQSFKVSKMRNVSCFLEDIDPILQHVHFVFSGRY